MEGVIVWLEGKHTYPVRLNQKRVEEEDEWWRRNGGRWVKKGRKRQDEERKENQTQAVRARINKGKI